MYWTVTTNTILDKKAEEELMNYIEGQDGWGEGFEQYPVSEGTETIEVDDEEDGGTYQERVRVRVRVYVSPWSHKAKNSTIKLIK